MLYPFMYVLACWHGDQYNLTPLYIGGVQDYGLYGSTSGNGGMCDEQ
jgi:hypothetical protein